MEEHMEFILGQIFSKLIPLIGFFYGTVGHLYKTFMRLHNSIWKLFLVAFLSFSSTYVWLSWLRYIHWTWSCKYFIWDLPKKTHWSLDGKVLKVPQCLVCHDWPNSMNIQIYSPIGTSFVGFSENIFREQWIEKEWKTHLQQERNFHTFFFLISL